MFPLHGFNKRNISLRQIHLIPLVIIAVATVAQLVYLIAIKVKIGIDIIVALGNICLPLGITRIEQIDIAFPTVGQRMGILIRMSCAFKDVPFFFHTVTRCIIERTEAKIIEHRLHSIRVLDADIILYRLCIDIPVGNILIYCIEMFARTAQRPVVLVVPILKLHTIDMATVQKSHFFLNFTFRFRSVESGDKAITRKACPVAGYIDGNSTENDFRTVFFSAIDIRQISGEIRCRGSPRPGTACDCLFGDYLVQSTVTYLGSRRQGISCEGNGFTRFVTSLVSSQVHG